jgi:DNA helicase-2/ATP-dependent DNA helicase PcrA
MRLFADLHIHSRFSRATSRDLNLVSLHHWAQRKGLTVVGTGDFTHPAWRAELVEQLEPAEPGLYRLRAPWQKEADSTLPPSCRGAVRFMLQVEISTIYKAAGATRKVHHVILCPSLEGAEKISVALEKIGNVTSDGRPILGLDSRDLLEITLTNCADACLIPAHIWTPWFSVLGSKSGFDSVEDCYRDLAGHIVAVETGLSSDPPMNWRLSGLDRFALVSNSDAHSPHKLGRECNEFDTELSYNALIRALQEPMNGGFLGTIEFFPEEGKYHLDGHRKCGIRLNPNKTQELGAKCPTCGRPVTIGVMHRVETLADRPVVSRPDQRPPFRRLIALAEAVGHAFNCGPATRKVAKVTDALQNKLGPELFLLNRANLDEVERIAGDVVAEALRRVRQERVRWQAGFDGQYGTFEVFEPGERTALSGQFSMFSRHELTQSGPASSTTGPDQAKAAASTRAPAVRPAATVRKEEPPQSAEPVLRRRGDDVEQDVTTTWLARLGEDQHQAVVYDEKAPLLILAGPGTGKTRTLTTRIAFRVQSGRLDPRRVLALTFSQRAAGEMGQRLDELLASPGQVQTATFHAWSLALLRRLGLARTTIFNDDERLEAVRQAARNAGIAKATAAHALSDALALAKAGRPTDTKALDLQPEQWNLFKQAYAERLEEAGALDFDDLILKATDALHQGQGDLALPHALFVDEYQDLNRAQVLLLQALAPAELCAIGDPDQAIYGFRGADFRAIVEFADDWPGAQTLTLGRSYRSCPTVLRAAAQVIAAGAASQRPALESDVQGAPKVCLLSSASEKSEADTIARTIEQLLGGTSLLSFDSGLVEGAERAPCGSLADVAVLFRLRSQGEIISESLRKAGFPVNLVRGNGMVHDETAALILAGLRCLAGRGHDADQQLLEAAEKQRSLFEGLNLGAEGHATSALDQLCQRILGHRAEGLDSVAPLWRAALRIDGANRGARNRTNRGLDELLDWIALHDEADDIDPRAERISLVTMHAAKGLEWPVVIVAGCEAGLVPLQRPGGATDAEEERRLLYVAMTRAERMLILSATRGRRMYGQKLPGGPSPFLEAIDPALLDRTRQHRCSKRKQQLQLFARR